MFFHDAIHRRLVSLLRPWLQDEPETELQLGLINSELTVKKFKLDVSALNNESESSRFKFREVTVDHLSLLFSNWSSPSCKIGIRGVNVTLLAGLAILFVYVVIDFNVSVNLFGFCFVLIGK